MFSPCFSALPDVAQGVARALSGGAKRLIVLPALLFAAGHAKDDIPAAVRAALGNRRDVELLQIGALECHPAVVEQSTRRFDEALAAQPSPAALDDMLLLMVGRGSSDACKLKQPSFGASRIGFGSSRP